MRVALVTGAAGGIGGATVARLVREEKPYLFEQGSTQVFGLASTRT